MKVSRSIRPEHMPGRHEPQHGDVSVDSLFLYLDEIGYTGWIGCEYTPLTTTAAGLTWAAPYGIEPH
jgi:hydroxypyruvate isomerase